MGKMLPVVLVFLGSGAGVGAGIFLRPDPVPDAVEAVQNSEDAATTVAQRDPSPDEETPPEGYEYVKMNNQFVVPVVQDEKVAALVVMSLSIEAQAGQSDAIYLREPKLRDVFLQVLFDHANIGGFEGAFTNAGTLDILRGALREAAQKTMGQGLVNDVLITEIARQDY
ncbi:flagellar basal body-associated FliL family protein [Sulfitobacter sabulilitoris]|uniref:Flagellar protein FliL n=1 Tax=Sulfitobacter sabulilitoris TaxID=2562655 RepID=A0A5S3PLD3_9RHOB|nr:flagellar basal body-associated FliL family protein [Sulfitobacter sabulilitoris]